MGPCSDEVHMKNDGQCKTSNECDDAIAKIQHKSRPVHVPTEQELGGKAYCSFVSQARKINRDP